MPQMQVLKSGSSAKHLTHGGKPATPTPCSEPSGLLNRIENVIANRMHDPPS